MHCDCAKTQKFRRKTFLKNRFSTSHVIERHFFCFNIRDLQCLSYDCLTMDLKQLIEFKQRLINDLVRVKSENTKLRNEVSKCYSKSVEFVFDTRRIFD